MRVNRLRPITPPQAYLNYMCIVIDRTRRVSWNRSDRVEMIRKNPRMRKRVCIVFTSHSKHDIYAVSIAC